MRERTRLSVQSTLPFGVATPSCAHYGIGIHDTRHAFAARGTDETKVAGCATHTHGW